MVPVIDTSSNSNGKTLWHGIFQKHLANLIAEGNIGENLSTLRDIIKTVPGFDESQIQAVLNGCWQIRYFNNLIQRIGGSELDLIDEARELQEEHGLDEDRLNKAIFHGVNERLLTLRLWIGAGDLSHAFEAHGLIERYGDIERYPGEGKRSELLIKNILRGLETAGIKAEIAAEKAVLMETGQPVSPQTAQSALGFIAVMNEPEASILG